MNGEIGRFYRSSVIGFSSIKDCVSNFFLGLYWTRCQLFSVYNEIKIFISRHVIETIVTEMLHWLTVFSSFNLLVFTRTWLRYIRVFAIADPSVCRRAGNGSMGHGSWVKWVTKIGWVTWVMGH